VLPRRSVDSSSVVIGAGAVRLARHLHRRSPVRPTVARPPRSLPRTSHVSRVRVFNQQLDVPRSSRVCAYGLAIGLLVTSVLRAAPAPATLSASTLKFGSQVAGTVAPVKTITLDNNQTVPLSNIAITVTGPFTQTNTCGTRPEVLCGPAWVCLTDECGEVAPAAG
jgi:hypothetical protein